MILGTNHLPLEMFPPQPSGIKTTHTRNHLRYRKGICRRQIRILHQNDILTMQIVTLDQVHTLHGSQIHNLNGIKYPQEIYVAN